MQNSEPIWDLVEAKRAPFIALSDRVFDAPELLYGEFRAVAEHDAALRAEGFRVVEAPAGIPTAVIGEAGDGGPVIAILGEYDALPGLSQEAGAAEHKPLEAGGPGHGCGHNLLGAAALLAATAVKDWLAANGVKARVRYYGCPAEEGGAAKTYMVRAGLFDDVDAAITWHPAYFTAVDHPRSLANTRIDFTFHGKAAHAAGAPELGRSALDAVELMNVGVNYMREHMPDEARIHYAYIDAGGAAPNVVQAKATVRQLIRAKDNAGLASLVARVRKIAEGAALMTETRVEAKVFSGVSNVLGNKALELAMQAEFDRLGAPAFDEEDRAFAAAIRGSLGREDVAAAFRRMGVAPDFGAPISEALLPYDRKPEGGDGSTDVGDVSWATPTVQARVTTCALGTPFHTWQLTAQGKSPLAKKGMVHAAKIMAATAAKLIREPAALAAAKAEHQKVLTESPYLCPIPDEVNPPILARPAA